MKAILIWNKPSDYEIAHRIIEEFNKFDIEILTEDQSTEAASVIIVLGGDGTMLHAIKNHQHRKMPFIGINTGTLGFLMNERSEKVEKLVRKIVSCDYEVFTYPMFDVIMTDINDTSLSHCFIGDVVVERITMNLTELELLIDDTPLNYFAGDGYIVTTPIGSTAYAVWAGGAAIHHSLHCLELVPMHPNDSARNLPLKIPLVVPAEAKIQFNVLFPELRGVRVAVDGCEIKPKESIKKVVIQPSEATVTFWNIARYDYLQRIKSKIIDKERIRKV